MQQVTGGSGFMANVTAVFARRYVFVGNHPRFALLQLHRMVQSALRSVESGRRPWGVYSRYNKYAMRVVYLQSGLFCGRQKPMLRESFCTICQSGADGDWWCSMKCSHYFHVKCIFAHFAHDKRCPLCRVRFLGSAVDSV
jgi:hypothetical protein